MRQLHELAGWEGRVVKRRTVSWKVMAPSGWVLSVDKAVIAAGIALIDRSYRILTMVFHFTESGISRSHFFHFEPRSISIPTSSHLLMERLENLSVVYFLAVTYTCILGPPK